MLPRSYNVVKRAVYAERARKTNPYKQSLSASPAAQTTLTLTCARNAATLTTPYFHPFGELSPSQKLDPATPWLYMSPSAVNRSGQK